MFDINLENLITDEEIAEGIKFIIATGIVNWKVASLENIKNLSDDDIKQREQFKTTKEDIENHSMLFLTKSLKTLEIMDKKQFNKLLIEGIKESEYLWERYQKENRGN